MNTKEKIIQFILAQNLIKAATLAEKFAVSRQYATRILKELTQDGILIKVGTTNGTAYVSPTSQTVLDKKVKKTLLNDHLEEFTVFKDIQKKAAFLSLLDENIQSIFTYAFSEMLNNAIEHSESKKIQIEIEKGKNFIFRINDTGIGVFRNIMKNRKLQSEIEAVQDLLKGKTTTQPQAHSGEGIFFTSKIADRFILESFGYKLTIDNRIGDVFLEEATRSKKGTRVTFEIDAASKKHLNDVFARYQTDPSEHAFDKTEIQIKLYTMGTIHVSRSQARRVLSGLEKFRTIIMDFEKVPTVGQAFADEIFRVFKLKYPAITVQPINMNSAVTFMVERVEKV